MQRISVQPRYGADFSGLQRGIAIGIAVTGIVTAAMIVEPSLRESVAGMLSGRSDQQSTAAGTAGSARYGEALRSLANEDGRWAASGMIAGLQRSEAVLELDQDRVELSLLGVRVYGLPMGAIDLSMLRGAKVVVNGHCASAHAASGACVVDSVHVVGWATDKAPANAFAVCQCTIHDTRAA